MCEGDNLWCLKTSDLKQRSRFKKKVRKDLDFMTRVCVCVSRDNACVPGSWEGGERLVENRLT